MPDATARRPARSQRPIAGSLLWQLAAVVGVLIIGVATIIGFQKRPMDAGELLVTVEKLVSHTAESQLLVERRLHGDVTKVFVTQHARQLQRKVESLGDALNGSEAEAKVDGSRRRAAELAVSLASVLGALDDHARTAQASAAHLNAIQGQIDSLQRAVEAAAR